MAITKEVFDELLKDCHRPDDFYGPDGLVKQFSKTLIERILSIYFLAWIRYHKKILHYRSYALCLFSFSLDFPSLR